MYILDTNIVIHLLNNSLSTSARAFLIQVIDSEPNISIVTKMETLGFNFNNEKAQISAQSFIAECNIIGISDEVVDATIGLRKIKKIKLPDAIIAATAIVQNLQLITQNTVDFKNIDGLKVIDLKVL